MSQDKRRDKKEFLDPKNIPDQNKAGLKGNAKAAELKEHLLVQIQAGPVFLDGNLHIPPDAGGLIVFVDGSAGAESSPRMQYVTDEMQAAGMATLLFDLMTPEEGQDESAQRLRFDTGLLARRIIGTVDWLSQQLFSKNLKIGLFGTGTNAAAALIAAAERPELVDSVMLHSGQANLAAAALPRIEAPVLLVVGQLDDTLVTVNKQALEKMQPSPPKELHIVPGAGHLFEEPGTIEYITRLAIQWFDQSFNEAVEKKVNKG